MSNVALNVLPHELYVVDGRRWHGSPMRAMTGVGFALRLVQNACPLVLAILIKKAFGRDGGLHNLNGGSFRGGIALCSYPSLANLGPGEIQVIRGYPQDMLIEQIAESN